MIFDSIMSNPPYNTSNDLSILSAISDLGQNICFIHPATWLYDKKHRFKTYLNLKKKFQGRLAAVKRIHNANELFDINLSTALTINLFRKKGQLDIWKFRIHQQNELVEEIQRKVKLFINNNSHFLQNTIGQQRVLTKQQDAFYIGTSWGRGHFLQNDFYSMFPFQYEYCLQGKKTFIWKFETQKERFNFFQYSNLKVVRFFLSLYKNNMHLNTGELEIVPFMKSYKRQWTDDAVAKQIDLTTQQVVWMINWMPDLYPVDAQIYKQYFDSNQLERSIYNKFGRYSGYLINEIPNQLK